MTDLNAAQCAIAVSNIRRAFAGVPVLRGCSLRVSRGEIHALLGQNGAGKSTLVKILNGVHPVGSFEGEIFIHGVRSSFSSAAQARHAGIGYVPQEIEVIEHLSVSENIFVGQTGSNSGLLVNRTHLHERARAVLNDLGLPLDPTAPVSLLTTAQRHLLMIARALAGRPAVLILDEPTASLSEREIEVLFIVLRTLKAQGVTMIYITHRLPEVFALCDRASVLRDGTIAAQFDRAEFAIEPLISAMTGRRMEALFPPHRVATKSASLLKAENFSVTLGGRRRVHNVSFELRAGEILGIAGVLGSGRTELLGALYGRFPYEGSLSIENRRCSITSIRKARKASIALLTEDRKHEGLLFNLPLRPNITIGHLKPLSWGGVVRSSMERHCVTEQLRALTVKAGSSEGTVIHLSGGNQQKLLFARVLLCAPKILLLDEPTKGVDVSAREEIYRLIATLAGRGVGVIVVSSDLNEVLGLADRCVVMAEGRFIDELARGQGTESSVLHAIARAQSLNLNKSLLRIHR